MQPTTYPKIIYRLSIIFLFFASVPGIAQTWNPVDKSSTIRFEIKNFGVTVKGYLSGIEGTIQFDPEHIEQSAFAVSVPSSSINTGIALRDKHLLKEEYLDALHYPLINFKSIDVKATFDKEKWIVRGFLTIKKVRKEILIPFSLRNNGSNGLSLKGSFKIDRREFDVGDNSFSMADSITIYLDVNIEKKQN